MVIKSASLVVIPLVAVCGATAEAGDHYIFEHNRSVVSWLIAGGEVIARYDRPRAGMEKVGVSQGTILFEGREQGDGFAGTAYTFRNGCTPAAYDVVGEWKGDWITLRGPAPTWSNSGCNILGYTLDSPHAVLRFRYAGSYKNE